MIVRKSDYWPCACVKRDRATNLTHIQLNHPHTMRCRKCGAERPDGWLEKIQAENDLRTGKVLPEGEP
jgi:hypothetical protein